MLQLLQSGGKDSEATIRRAITEGAGPAQYRAASPSELAWLKEQKAVTAGTKAVKLVSLNRAKWVCRYLGRAVLATQLDNITLNHGVSLTTTIPQLDVRATPSPHMPQAAIGASQAGYDSTSPSIQPNVPATLPVLCLTEEQAQISRYGLTTQADAKRQVAAVKGWLQMLHAWCTAPLRFDRPAHIRALTDASWETTQAEVYRFLGFIRLFAGVEQPNLHHYLNGHLVAKYASFLKARSVTPAQLADVINQARRVIAFLAHTRRLEASDLQLLSEYNGWLANMGGQLARLQPLPKPNLQQLEQQGKWMRADELMVRMHRVLERARARIWAASVAETAARFLMQALFCCTSFGYLPPIRPSVLLSLQHPGYTGPCMHKDCQHPSVCPGNTLQWEEGTGNNSGKPMLRLHAPHHKVSKWWGSKPIDCLIPDVLGKLYFAYFTGARELILSLSGKKDNNSPFTFVQPRTGKQVRRQQASKWFTKLVLPSTHRFGPRTARSIFVTAAKNQELGPLDTAAAAKVMGHCLTMWESVYDKEAMHRATSANVVALAQWRDRVVMEATTNAEQDVVDLTSDTDSDMEFSDDFETESSESEESEESSQSEESQESSESEESAPLETGYVSDSSSDYMSCDSGSTA